MLMSGRHEKMVEAGVVVAEAEKENGFWSRPTGRAQRTRGR